MTQEEKHKPAAGDWLESVGLTIDDLQTAFDRYFGGFERSVDTTSVRFYLKNDGSPKVDLTIIFAQADAGIMVQKCANGIGAMNAGGKLRFDDKLPKDDLKQQIDKFLASAAVEVDRVTDMGQRARRRSSSTLPPVT